jgi:hypothetical protein
MRSSQPPREMSPPRPPQTNNIQSSRPIQSRPGHAGQWLNQHRDLPPDQQKRALDSDPQFRRLPAQRQKQLQDRLQRFDRLPPEQQQRVLNRMETWEHLTPQQKQQARGLHSQMQQLPPERRHAVQNAINALRGMPPQARQQAIESGRFSQLSPQERELLNGASQLPLAPSEANPEGENVPRPPR